MKWANRKMGVRLLRTQLEDHLRGVDSELGVEFLVGT